jgi:hypothetical protein
MKERAGKGGAASMKKTGRSADSSAGAAAAKKATARAKATGQTKQSAMDAVSRRYKPESKILSRTENNGPKGEPRKVTSLLTIVRDKKTGYPTSTYRGMNYTDRYLKSEPIATAAKKKRRTPKK